MLTQTTKEDIYKLLAYLNIKKEAVELTDNNDEININLHIPEAEAGIFIGRYAETLDAVQRIISLFVNNNEPVHTNVLVDIANYRHRRYTKLISLAEKLAQEVKTYGTPRAFPLGLSATERRQLHLYFSRDAELTTYSKGQGAGRRLYLAPKNSLLS